MTTPLTDKEIAKYASVTADVEMSGDELEQMIDNAESRISDILSDLECAVEDFREVVEAADTFRGEVVDRLHITPGFDSAEPTPQTAFVEAWESPSTPFDGYEVSDCYGSPEDVLGDVRDNLDLVRAVRSLPTNLADL